MPGQSRDNPGIVAGQSRAKLAYVFLAYWLYLVLRQKKHATIATAAQLGYYLTLQADWST